MGARTPSSRGRRCSRRRTPPRRSPTFGLMPPSYRRSPESRGAICLFAPYIPTDAHGYADVRELFSCMALWGSVDVRADPVRRCESQMGIMKTLWPLALLEDGAPTATLECGEGVATP